MDQQTYEQKVRELKASHDDDAPRRLALLEQTHKAQLEFDRRRQEEKQQAAEASFKASMKRSYMQQPNATKADFERDYPSMRADHLKRTAAAADQASRAANRAMYRDN
jgi:hypothetical protein